MWMMRRGKWFVIAPLALTAMVLFVFLGGEIVRLLWNWLLPSLFGIRQITFWEALGVLVLSRILFGRMGVRGSPGWKARRRIEERMAERWEQMTPEERERFRHGMPGRWGFRPPSADRDHPGTQPE